MSLTIEQALARFLENEARLNTFMNSLDPYITNDPVNPKPVETLFALITRLQNRYLTIVSKGDWLTGTVYSINDVVKQAGAVYLCVVSHTAGTFATDLAAAKWIVYQGLVGPLQTTDYGDGTVTNAKLAGAIANSKLADPILAAGVGNAASKTVGTGDTQLPTNADIRGAQTIWVPASAMYPRIVNGATAEAIEIGAVNKVVSKTLVFSPSEVQYAQFCIRMPNSWNEGTIQANFVWSQPTGTGGVIWGLQAISLSDLDAMDTAFSATSLVTDTGGTADTIYISGDLDTALNPAGVEQPKDFLVFQVSRQATGANDTLNVNARLHGVTLVYTKNANTDA